MAKADLWILFASQTGNAKSVAEQCHKAAQKYAIEAVLRGMDEIAAPDMAAMDEVLLIISTAGEGDCPDQAQALWQALQDMPAHTFPQMRFSVFALGDSLYDHFCAAGKRWDAQLEALGACRRRERVDADIEFEEKAQQWIAESLAQLALEYGWMADKQEAEDMAPQSGYSRQLPLDAVLLEKKTLTGAHSLREVVHCEIAVGAHSFKAGDLLYVLAQNRAEWVAEMLALLQAGAADQVQWQGGYLRLDRVLREEAELRLPSQALRDYLGLGGDAAGDVLDMLRAAPFPLDDVQAVLDTLAPLRARAYSIASVPHEGGSLALTVGRVQYERHGRMYYGLASNWLADLPPGSRFRAYLHENPYFAPPADPHVAMIMVATGTGIAPFRGFMQARARQQAKGANWLIFGDRFRSEDFLYGDEWLAWQKSGLLNDLSLAFSRDQQEKIYVQDVLRAQGEKLFAWLETGASFYVCGDALRMAAGVEQALHEIVAKHGNMSAANAAAYVARLKNDKRYCRDVY